MSYHQYRITVNGSQSDITNDYASITERWSRIAERLEARGGVAVLETRLVTDRDIMALVVDPRGYIQVNDENGNPITVCPWHDLANLDMG